MSKMTYTHYLCQSHANMHVTDLCVADEDPCGRNNNVDYGDYLIGHAT